MTSHLDDLKKCLDMAYLFKRKTSVNKVETGNSNKRYQKNKEFHVESILNVFKKSRDKSLNKSQHHSNQLNSGIFRSGHKFQKENSSVARGSPSHPAMIQSQVDLNERKIGNCMINNLYFIPKFHKQISDSAKRINWMNSATLAHSSSRKNKKADLAKSYSTKRKSLAILGHDK